MSHRTPRDPAVRGAKRPAGSKSARWARSRSSRPARPKPPQEAAPAHDPARAGTVSAVELLLRRGFRAVTVRRPPDPAAGHRRERLRGTRHGEGCADHHPRGDPRAPIYDRNGVELAETVDAAKLVADPTYTHDHATQIAAILHRRIGVDYLDLVVVAAHAEHPLRRAGPAPLTGHGERGRGAAQPAGAARRLRRPRHAAGLPGWRRRPPTWSVSWAPTTRASAASRQSFDTTLQGRNGSATYQVASGQILPLAGSTVVQPREGTGVRLTIDQDLQFLAQRRLAEAVKGARADSGVAIVMDARTSQVLALADYPTFNPNDPFASKRATGARGPWTRPMSRAASRRSSRSARSSTRVT